MPRYAADAVDLLTNASATGAGKPFSGGRVHLVLMAGTGGATIELQVLGPDGATYVPVSGASATSSTAIALYLPAGTYRGAVTGGTSPAGIYARIAGVL